MTQNTLSQIQSQYQSLFLAPPKRTMNDTMYSVVFDQGLPVSHIENTQVLARYQEIEGWSYHSPVEHEHVNMYFTVFTRRETERNEFLHIARIRLLVTEDMVGHRFGQFAMKQSLVPPKGPKNAMYSVLFDHRGFPFSHMKEIQAHPSKGAKQIVCWSRCSSVTQEHVNMYFNVHNGETFIRLLVTEGMVGHRFNAFAVKKRQRGVYSPTKCIEIPLHHSPRCRIPYAQLVKGELKHSTFCVSYGFPPLF
jgi:ribosomal protein S19